MRAASLRDLDMLVRIINAAYLVERSFVDGDRISPETVRTLMRKGTFFLGEDDAGAACACVYVELRGRRGYFGLLAVDPERQRGGWGRRMIDAAEAHCRAAGCDAMDIRVVNLREELPPFYRRLGYVERGTEPFDDPRAFRPCHMIVMTKNL
ncbi:MAG TPA: GNAT family N-acetyltransferase [Vicinamibacterales bacterium]|nr:GNAT family N-acetyltransferase [Vicinamibacterales bacterium]